ncbi:type IV pilus twitching motility protein PilT [Candidatus Omnitrophota bacterium]
MKIFEYLEIMIKQKASDMLLRAGGIPRLRVDGKICPLDTNVLTAEDMKELSDQLMTSDDYKKKFKETLEVDFAISVPNLGRFRVIIFLQRSTPSIVIRHVHDQSQTFEELHLPEKLMKTFANENRGLILATGPAGSGKSTAVASLLEYVNVNLQKHIITVEDPIEFMFKDKKSIINQRELGLDVPNYPEALKHFTLQSPDVIFIGLIRDPETMQAAISAAEMGVMVVSTFHTVNAMQTIERIVNFFPPYLHNEVKMRLSLLLKGIISLRLVPLKDSTGRIPAYESMVLTPSIARLLREGKMWEMRRFIEEGEMFGMQTFNQSLVKMVKEGKIDENTAREFADSKDEFELELKGIKRIA